MLSVIPLSGQCNSIVWSAWNVRWQNRHLVLCNIIPLHLVSWNIIPLRHWKICFCNMAQYIFTEHKERLKQQRFTLFCRSLSAWWNVLVTNIKFSPFMYKKVYVFVTAVEENNFTKTRLHSSLRFLTFIYFTSLREQNEACIISSQWEMLVGLELANISMRVTWSTTVLQTPTILTLCLLLSLNTAESNRLMITLNLLLLWVKALKGYMELH